MQWKVKKQFAFKSDEYNLRKKRLIVEIRNEDQKIRGELKISLFKIATGPYHQDFLINTKNDKDFRISFDFKIAQIIEVQAQVVETKIDLKNQYPGDAFTFYIKTIIGNSSWISEPAFIVRISLEEDSKKADKGTACGGGKMKMRKFTSIAQYEKIVSKG